MYNADIIQPGLMQLEPDFDDDFMDTLESLTGENFISCEAGEVQGR